MNNNLPPSENIERARPLEPSPPAFGGQPKFAWQASNSRAVTLSWVIDAIALRKAKFALRADES
jgi:hypothetical protein